MSSRRSSRSPGAARSGSRAPTRCCGSTASRGACWPTKHRARHRRAALNALLHAGAPSRANHEERPALLEALAALPPADRDVLTLTAWEGLSAAEAGVVLHCSEGAIHTRLHRARARLRAELDRQHALLNHSTEPHEVPTS
jgi:DNA-directed RNA polymerase specialized sigma24 family protein